MRQKMLWCVFDHPSLPYILPCFRCSLFDVWAISWLICADMFYFFMWKIPKQIWSRWYTRFSVFGSISAQENGCSWIEKIAYDKPAIIRVSSSIHSVTQDSELWKQQSWCHYNYHFPVCGFGTLFDWIIIAQVRIDCLWDQFALLLSCVSQF